MKTLFYLKITLLFVFFSTISFAQQQTTTNPIVKKVYYYTFNTESIASIDVVLTNIKALAGVIESKYEYKPENNAGQLIVIVQEKNRTSESDILFQPTDLKRILSENGFIPNELTTEELKN